MNSINLTDETVFLGGVKASDRDKVSGLGRNSEQVFGVIHTTDGVLDKADETAFIGEVKALISDMHKLDKGCRIGKAYNRGTNNKGDVPNKNSLTTKKVNSRRFSEGMRGLISVAGDAGVSSKIIKPDDLRRYSVSQGLDNFGFDARDEKRKIKFKKAQRGLVSPKKTMQTLDSFVTHGGKTLVSTESQRVGKTSADLVQCL